MLNEEPGGELPPGSFYFSTCTFLEYTVGGGTLFRMVVSKVKIVFVIFALILKQNVILPVDDL